MKVIAKSLNIVFLEKITPQKILVTLFLCSAIFSAVSVTNAYNTYVYKWNTNTVTYSEYFLPSQWRWATWEAARQWNNVTPSPFSFAKTNTLGGGQGAATFGYIDGAGGTLAFVNRGDNGSHLTSFSMSIDSEESWTAGPPSSSEHDFVGAVAHEFGHVAGINHTQWWRCWGNVNNWPTMCSYIAKGTAAFRYFEQDDRDALNALYP